jgi:hypothetical protein
MKKYLFLMVLTVLCATGAHADTKTGAFTCVSNSMRGGMGTEQVDARFTFRLSTAGEGFVLEKLVGHVIVATEQPESVNDNYYSVFVLKKVNQNFAYKPRRYVDSIQFPKVDTQFSSTHDGGGMSGELVISKDNSEKTFEAHYIFQTGDHMGGTIDLVCVQ